MKAAEQDLPSRARMPSKPCNSENALKIIDLRMAARAQNNFAEEKELHKKVRRSAQMDRTLWLNGALENGSWKSVVAIREHYQPNKGQLVDANGKLCESNEWAETMACHLETVQW